MEQFWKTYRTISLYLIVPAVGMLVISLFFICWIRIRNALTASIY